MDSEREGVCEWGVVLELRGLRVLGQGISEGTNRTKIMLCLYDM